MTSMQQFVRLCLFLLLVLSRGWETTGGYITNTLSRTCVSVTSMSSAIARYTDRYIVVAEALDHQIRATFQTEPVLDLLVNRNLCRLLTMEDIPIVSPMADDIPQDFLHHQGVTQNQSLGQEQSVPSWNQNQGQDQIPDALSESYLRWYIKLKRGLKKLSKNCIIVIFLISKVKDQAQEQYQDNDQDQDQNQDNAQVQAQAQGLISVNPDEAAEPAGSIPALVITQAEEVSSKAWWEATWLSRCLHHFPLCVFLLCSLRKRCFWRSSKLCRLPDSFSSSVRQFGSSHFSFCSFIVFLFFSSSHVGLVWFYCCNYTLSLPPVTPADVGWCGCFSIPPMLHTNYFKSRLCFWVTRWGVIPSALITGRAHFSSWQLFSRSLFFLHGRSFYQHIFRACWMHMQRTKQ